MNEELKNDNTQVVQPVLPIPTTNIDWITVANNKIDKSIQEQLHSEVVRHPKRPKTEEEAMTIMFDPRKAPQTSTTQVIGMSPVDPVGEFVVGSAVLGKPLQLLGKGLLYGAGRVGNNWARAKIISNKLNKPISQEALNQVNEIFRTSEWNQFLMSKNGYNYYRINTPKAKGDEMIFLSHTTPWEEFIPKLDISVPAYAELGPKLLYEFPHKTFGTLKASGYKPGSFGDVDARRYGLQHLLYGKYASGKRGLVRNMSSKNYMRAKQAGLDVDEFKIGLKKRPLVNGHYDHNPIYEDIYNGYQTQIKADDFFTAVKTKPHMTYEYTDNGIQKILWNP